MHNFELTPELLRFVLLAYNLNHNNTREVTSIDTSSSRIYIFQRQLFLDDGLSSRYLTWSLRRSIYIRGALRNIHGRML